jgi:hypothetical protein
MHEEVFGKQERYPCQEQENEQEQGEYDKVYEYSTFCPYPTRIIEY